MRFPKIYYIVKHKIARFVERNFTGCAYCNEKKVWKIFGYSSRQEPIPNFNTLLDSVPVGDSKLKIACYFFPKQRCIEVCQVDENGKHNTVESIFVHHCPECGRPLPYTLDKKKKKEKVVIASTPLGPNHFYNLWNKSTEKPKDANDKILSELEETLKDMPDDKFHSLMDLLEKVATTR